MIEIKLKQWSWEDDTTEEGIEELPTVASGENAEDTLKNLIEAINADEVDTENCKLIIVY